MSMTSKDREPKDIFRLMEMGWCRLDFRRSLEFCLHSFPRREFGRSVGANLPNSGWLPSLKMVQCSLNLIHWSCRRFWTQIENVGQTFLNYALESLKKHCWQLITICSPLNNSLKINSCWCSGYISCMSEDVYLQLHRLSHNCIAQFWPKLQFFVMVAFKLHGENLKVNYST